MTPRGRSLSGTLAHRIISPMGTAILVRQLFGDRGRMVPSPRRSTLFTTPKPVERWSQLDPDLDEPDRQPGRDSWKRAEQELKARDRVGDGRTGSDGEDMVEAQVDEPGPEIEALAEVDHRRDIVGLDT